MLPKPDTLNDYPFGKFVLTNLAAKRAKQLGEDAVPLIPPPSQHDLTIALYEIAANKIAPVVREDSDVADQLDATSTLLISEEPLPAELGMLLPALDETEVALVLSDEVDEAEEEELDDLALSDLVESEDEVEAPESSDSLSLSDIAEDEELAESDGEPQD